MTAIHKKLALNDLRSIDFYDENNHWQASISEMEPDWWTLKLQSSTYYGRFQEYNDALKQLCFWLDVPVESIQEFVGG